MRRVAIDEGIAWVVVVSEYPKVCSQARDMSAIIRKKILRKKERGFIIKR